jgi:hypothetical protein
MPLKIASHLVLLVIHDVQCVFLPLHGLVELCHSLHSAHYMFQSMFRVVYLLFSYSLNEVCFFFLTLFSYLLITVMAGMAPEGSQFDEKHYDSKIQELLYVIKN